MASVVVPNPPTDITMADFKAMSDSHKGLAFSARYIVRIVPQGEFIAGYGAIARDLMYLCEAAEYPGRGLESVDVRYNGPNFKMPFKSAYEEMNLTFICRNQSFEREFFDDWMMYINPPNTFDFNYLEQYRAEIQVFQLANYSADGASENPVVEYAFTLHDAWPTRVNPQPITWADDQFLRLGMTFTYKWWTRPGRDPVARTTAGANASFQLTPNAIR